MQAPRVGDLGCILAALFIGGLSSDATDVAAGAYADVNDLVGMAAIAALWWRRRAPLAIACTTFVAAAAAPLASGAAIVSVYTVAAHVQRRIPVVVVALYVVSSSITLVLFPDDELGAAGNVLGGVLTTFAAFGWGLAVRRRRELVAALTERAERAEADQHARVLEARRTERTRIAAEMHDVLAHRLSMLSLHAGAIEARPGAAPEDLAKAAGVVRSSAHLALEDLRTVIGVLRDDSTTDDLVTRSTAADIGALVEECRAAGMRIDFADGALAAAPMPSDVSRHAYRIAQEGLTNARKHAPGQTVQLSLTGRAGDGLHVEIVNPVSRANPEPDVPGAGVGLVGLRERVGLAGGTFEAGIDDTDRHHLRAWLPWSV